MNAWGVYGPHLTDWTNDVENRNSMCTNQNIIWNGHSSNFALRRDLNNLPCKNAVHSRAFTCVAHYSIYTYINTSIKWKWIHAHGYIPVLWPQALHWCPLGNHLDHFHTVVHHTNGRVVVSIPWLHHRTYTYHQLWIAKRKREKLQRNI